MPDENDPTQVQPQDNILIELDVDTLDNMKREKLAELVPHVSHFVVGTRLLTSEGFPLVNEFIGELGGKIFYDGGLCLPPREMRGVVKALASYEAVDMFSVRLACGWRSVVAALVPPHGKKVVGIASTLKPSPNSPAGKHDFRYSVRSFIDYRGYAYLCPVQRFEAFRSAYKDHLGAGTDLIRLIASDTRPVWVPQTEKQKTQRLDHRTPGLAIRRGANAGVVIRWSDLVSRKVGGQQDLPIKLQTVRKEMLAARSALAAVA